MHVKVRETLNNNGGRKFFITTPEKGTRTYLQIFDLVEGVSPISCQIVTDMSYVLNSSLKIVSVHGIVLEDYNHQTRRRREAGVKKNCHQGGKIKRK